MCDSLPMHKSSLNLQGGCEKPPFFRQVLRIKRRRSPCGLVEKEWLKRANVDERPIRHMKAIVDSKHGTKISTSWPKLTTKECTKPSSVGWVTPRKGSTIVQNRNPFITSIRHLFKLKHPFVDRENKIIYTMPARFSEKMDMYAFENLWVKELDPKVVSKLIYICTTLGYGVAEPDKVKNIRMQDIDHSYVGINKPKSGYKFFRGKNDPKPIESRHLLEFDMDTSKTVDFELLRKIKSSIDRLGGWVNYCLSNSKARPDAFGRITLKDGLPSIDPCNLVPIKMCKFCGTINIYSQYCAGNKVHDSIKHYHPAWLGNRYRKPHSEHDVNNDISIDYNEFKTKYNPDGTSEVIWRCCMCQGDLNTLVITNLASIYMLVKAIWNALFVLCGQLDELLKMGYGDVYDELNEQQKLTIRSHDKSIIKEYFFHLRQKIIMCGNDLDRLSRSQIGRNIGNLHLTHDTRMNSIKPELIAEISLANKLITQSTREAEHEIRYNVIPNFNDKRLHNSKFIDWVFKNSIVSNCNTANRCHHPTERFVYYGFAGCCASILEILLTCCVQHHTYVIMPLLDKNGKFRDESNFTTSGNGEINLFLNGLTHPLTFKEDTFSVLNNFDCIIFKNKLFIVTTEVRLDFVIVKMITGPYDNIEQLPTHKNISNKETKIRVSLPSLEGIMGNWSGINFQENEFNLDMKLFRALCVRNLSGKVSFENAREFAVGYAIRNFIVHSKQVMNVHVQYQDIDIHVILSQICMMTLRSNYSNSVRYTEWSRYLGPLRSLIPSIDEKFTSVALFVITELLYYVTGLETTTIISLLTSSHISRWIKGFCSVDFWQNLLMIAEKLECEPTKYYKLESDQQLPSIKSTVLNDVCMHHTTECCHAEGENYCECCGLACDTRFCDCCQDNKQPDFWSFKDSTLKSVDHESDDVDEATLKRVKQRIVEQDLYEKLRPNKKYKRVDNGNETDSPIPTVDEPNKRTNEFVSHIPEDQFETLKAKTWSTDTITKNLHNIKPEQYMPLFSNQFPDSEVISAAIIELEPQHMPDNDSGALTDPENDPNPNKADHGQNSNVKDTNEDLIKEHDYLPTNNEGSCATKEDLVDPNERTSFFKWPTLRQANPDKTTPSGMPITDQSHTEINESKSEGKWKNITSKNRKLPKEVQKVIDEIIGEQTSEDITRLINELLPIIGERFVLHVTDPIKYEGLTNERNDYDYTLDHAFIGLTLVPRSTFKVVKIHDVPNTSDLTCGFDAYVNATGSSISLDRFREIAKADNYFSQFHILDVAKHEERNLILVTEDGITIQKYDYNSSNFPVIQLIPPETTGGVGHFVRCKIERQTNFTMMLAATNPGDRSARTTFLNQMGFSDCELTQVEELKPKDILELEYKVAKLKNQLSGAYAQKIGLTIYKRQGRTFITNNITKVHDLAAGEFNVECDPDMRLHVDKLATVINTSCHENSIPGHYDKPIGLPTDLLQFRKEYVNDILRELCRSRTLDSMTSDKNVRAHYNGILSPWKAMGKLTITNALNSKLKLLDKVIVEFGGVKHVLTIVDRVIKGWMVNIPVLQETKVKVIESKLSFGSNLRNILSYIKPLISPSDFRNVLKNTKAVTGPAGSGKTTQIVGTSSPGDVILAMTGEAVRNLREKIPSNRSIYSVERFRNMVMNHPYKLFIDEATMLDWVALWPLVHKDTTVTLFGSDRQVGYIDTSETPGVRSVDSIMYVIDEKNKTRLSTTYRLGNPLVERIKCLEPNLSTLADHNTTLDIVSLVWDDKNRLREMVLNFKPDSILCMYNKVKSELIALMPECEDRIYTTHSFQGNEVERALIVLKSDRTNEWGLNGNADYLYSAVTRAKYQCKIVVIDRVLTAPYNIEQLITMHGGGNSNSNDYDEDEDLITLRNMHHLDKDEIHQLNEMKAEVNGVKLRYYKDGAGTRVEAKMGPMHLATIINYNGKVSVTAKELIQKKVYASLDEPLPEIKKADLKSGVKTKNVCMAFRSVNRLKELGWIVDKHPEGKMTMKILDNQFTVVKGYGCPTMCSYTFEEGGNFLYISNAWKKTFSRTIKYKQENKSSVLAVIMQWLDLDQDGYCFDVNYADTWLWMLQGDTKTAIKQYFERLSHLHVWLLNALFNSDAPKCHTNNMKNMYKYNNFVGHDKTLTITSHQSVMPHEVYMSEGKNWFWQKQYTLFDIQGELLSLRINSPDSEYREFVVEALGDLWFGKPSEVLKGVDLNTIDIPGLLLTVPKHMEDRGDIATYIKSGIAQTILDCKNPLRDFLVVNSRVRNQIQGMINSDFPHQQLMPTDATTYLSHCEVVVEQVCMNHWFRDHKTTSHLESVYGGCFIIGLCYNNLYHVKLMEMDHSHHAILHVNMQWPSYKDMKISRFKTAVEKPNSQDLTSKLDKPGILILGIEIISYKIEKIIDIMIQNKELTIIGAVPMTKSQNMWYTIQGTGLIIYKNGTYARKIDNKLQAHSRDGSPLFVGDDEFISVENCFEVAEHRVIALQWRQKPNNSVIQRSLEAPRVRPNIIVLTVPWIDFNIVNILQTSSLITIKKLTVNTKLLRTLLIRLMTGDDSWDSLLAYARTIESTYIVTENKLDEMQAHSIPELLNTAWYALFLHHNYIGKFKMLSQITDTARDSELIKQLLNQLLPGLLQMANVASNLIAEQSKELINKMSKRLSFNGEAIDAIIRLEKTEWLRYQHKNRVVMHNLSIANLDSSPADYDNSSEPDDRHDFPEYNDDEFIEMRNNHNSLNEQQMNTVFEQLEKQLLNGHELNGNVRNQNIEVVTPHVPAKPIKRMKSKITQDNVESDETSNMGSETDIFHDAPVEFYANEEGEMYTTCVIDPEEIDKDEINEASPATTECTSTGIDLSTQPGQYQHLDKYNTPTHMLALVREHPEWLNNRTLLIREQNPDFKDSFLVCAAEKSDKDTSEAQAAFGSLWKSIKDRISYSMRYTLDVNLQCDDAAVPKSISFKYMKSKKYGHSIPKVIWAYWHSDRIPLLVWKMLEGWTVKMPDYDLILLTKSTCGNFVPNECLEFQNIGAAHYSDLIRTTVLARYGGIYLDASSYLAESLVDLINQTLESKEGFFQFSLSQYCEQNKSYENWFLISTVGNRYMAALSKELLSMNRANVSNNAELQVWLTKRFGTATAERAIRGVQHDLIYYLRAYTIQEALIKELDIDVSNCIFSNECAVTFWACQWDKTWIEKVKSLWGEPMSSVKTMQPIIKLISTLRRAIITYDDTNGIANKNSLLDLLRKAPLRFENYVNVTVQNSLVDRVPSLKQEPDFVYVKTDVYVLCTGSTGDLNPCLFLAKLFINSGASVTLVTHRDHKNRARNVCPELNFLPLRTTSSELMMAGISFINKVTLPNMLSANQTYNQLKEEIDHHLASCDLNNKIIIATGLTPNLDNYTQEIKANWTITNPFPAEWVTGSDSDGFIPACKNFFARRTLDFKAKLNQKPNVDRLNQEPYLLYTYNRQLMDNVPHENNATTFITGPLTTNEQYNSPNLDEKSVYIALMFGSCVKYINQYHLSMIAQFYISKGYKTIIHYNPNHIKAHTHLKELVDIAGENLIITNEINLAAIAHRIDAVITHGGAGTVTECLRLNIPVLVFPIFADQPYWARMVDKFGYGGVLTYDSLTNLEVSLHATYIKIPQYREMLVKQISVHNDGYQLRRWFNIVYKSQFNLHKLQSAMSKNFSELEKFEFIKMKFVGLPPIMGIYETNQFTIQTENYVKTSSHCVSGSLNQLLNPDGQRKMKVITNSCFQRILAAGVTPNECINGILSVGVNLIVAYEGKLTYYNIFPENACICLRFSKSGAHMHCSPIVELTSKCWKPVIVNGKSDSILQLDIKAAINKLRADILYPLWLLWEPEMLARWMGRAFVQDCEARFNMSAIVALKTRRVENCINVELTQCDELYYTVCPNRDTTPRLGLLLGKTGWKLITYMVSEELLIIFCKEPINRKNVLMDLGKPIGCPESRLTSVTSRHTKACLNRATREHLNATNDQNATDIIYHEGLTDFTLIATTYDNRSHHIIDEQSIIERATQVIGANNQLIDPHQFKPSYNKPYNRMCLMNGKIFYAIECATSDEAKYTRSILSAAVKCDDINLSSNTIFMQNGNMVYTYEPLPDVVLNTIFEYMKTFEVKLKFRYPIENMVSISYDDLRQLLIKTYESWPKLVNLLHEMETLKWDNDEELHVMNQLTFPGYRGGSYHNEPDFEIVCDAIFLYVSAKVIRKVNRGGSTNQPILEAVSTARNIESHNLQAKNLEPKSTNVDKERESWKDSSNLESFNYKTKWHFDENALRLAIQRKLAESTMTIKCKPTANNVDIVPEFKQISFLNIMTYSDENFSTPLPVGAEFDEDLDNFYMDMYIAPFNHRYCADDLDVIHDWPDLSAIKLWNNTDLTNWLTIYAPLNEMRIVSNELPLQVIKTEKVTLTKYPQRSRAVLTKVCYEEIRAIAGRLGSVVKIRRNQPNPSRFILELAETYFHPNWRRECNNYIKNPLLLDPKDVQDWITENKSCPSIVKELITTLAGEIMIKPMSDVNIHLKLESLLKEEPIRNWREQQSRVIVWQRKAVCAIYSKLFVEAKNRLKSLLRTNILYTDGLRPDEISARMRLTKNVHGFFENDLKKQDRQTDDPIIDVEMRMYHLLGVHKNVISSWRMMHDDWRFKSSHCRGTRKAMRLTGQATTALGNCITNLQVHCEFVKRNIDKLEMALFLGDDMCMAFREKPNMKNLKNYIATMFNMQSKESWHNNYGTFCSMIVTKLTEGNCQVAPDVVRMKYRYEVTNGVHEVDEVNLLMRAASYLMNLGGTPEVNETIKDMQLPITPTEWYDFNAMIIGCSEKYNLNYHQIMAYYKDLLNMIKNPTIYRHEFRHYTSSTSKSRM